MPVPLLPCPRFAKPLLPWPCNRRDSKTWSRKWRCGGAACAAAHCSTTYLIVRAGVALALVTEAGVTLALQLARAYGLSTEACRTVVAQ